jgi:tetratricopeptide (TPR) repeat protein
MCQQEGVSFEGIRAASMSALAGHILRRGLLVTVILFLCGSTVTGQDASSAEHELGTVQFGVSCSAESSEAFDRALALLHHMQYEESRTAFSRIIETDPACGMAYWGRAMTRFQPLWPERPGPDALQSGREDLQKAQKLGSMTDREHALVSAAEAFYREPESAEWWTRIRRWSEAMNRAYEARPNDIETAAFFALSQLAVGQVESDRMAYHARAANVLLDIYEREPRHPGAIHYTIHANDVDSRANESIEVVRSYNEIAPEVPHALHMPTHIFVRLGEWSEVIEWNRKSAAAALRHPAPDGISHHYAHALDYLVYAYLQRGEDERALRVIDELMARDGPFQGTFVNAFHFAAMPARYAVERRAWEEARTIAPRTPESVKWDKFWWPESISWFARGLGAVHTGDTAEATRAERRMIELRDAARSAEEDAFADYIEIDRLVLAAWQKHGSGQHEKALQLARNAVQIEETTQKHPVTPGALYPSHEALGDLLLLSEQPGEALTSYEASLAEWPGRLNSVVGAIHAARAAGQEKKVQEHYRAFSEITSGADVRRAELTKMKQLLNR